MSNQRDKSKTRPHCARGSLIYAEYRQCRLCHFICSLIAGFISISCFLCVLLMFISCVWECICPAAKLPMSCSSSLTRIQLQLISFLFRVDEMMNRSTGEQHSQQHSTAKWGGKNNNNCHRFIVAHEIVNWTRSPIQFSYVNDTHTTQHTSGYTTLFIHELRSRKKKLKYRCSLLSSPPSPSSCDRWN